MFITVKHPLASSFESVTVSTVAIGLTGTKYNPGDSTGGSYQTQNNLAISRKNADIAMVTVEGDQIRWTCDGTTPTSTVGHRANVDDVLTLEGYDAIRLFKAIRLTTDATLKVSYFGA